MTQQDVVQDREREFVAALKADGLRMTHQRLEVIRELASAKGHPDIDELFRVVRGRVPTISIDTVYRTVSSLVSRGLVQRIAAPGPARFDPDTAQHHHFVCGRCGRVEDIDAASITAPAAPRDLDGVGRVESVRLELRGLCDACDSAGTK